MRAEEFKSLIRRQPLTPLRAHLTDGRTFDIKHPDQVLVLRQRIDIGIPADDMTDILDRVEYVSLLHVVRVEDLPTSSNGERHRNN